MLEGAVWLDMGLLELADNHVAKAIECLTKSHGIALKINNPGLEAESVVALGRAYVQSGALELAAQKLNQAMEICSELRFKEKLGVLHSDWVHYHLAVARQSANAKETAAALAAAHKSLADAEGYAKRLSTLPSAAFSKEIAEARRAIEEFEREQSAQQDKKG